MPTRAEEFADRTETILRQVGALLENGHFININGSHSSSWIDKDAVNPHVPLVNELCQMLWQATASLKPELVCGPAVGGLIVAMGTAYHAGLPAVFTEHQPAKGDELRGQFVLRRGYDRLVKGKRVLVVDDVVNSGQSARQTIEAVTAAGGKVCGVACYVDRGNLSPAAFDTYPYSYLLQWKSPSWPEAQTPPEVLARPINMQHGHGTEYVVQRATES